MHGLSPSLRQLNNSICPTYYKSSWMFLKSASPTRTTATSPKSAFSTPKKGGDVLRLENFRCNHPDGTTTKSETTVKAIVGDEHLVLGSNRTFRMIYSKAKGNQILSRLEMREFYDDDGSYICTVRNIDGNYPAFGTS